MKIPARIRIDLLASRNVCEMLSGSTSIKSLLDELVSLDEDEEEKGSWKVISESELRNFLTSGLSPDDLEWK